MRCRHFGIGGADLVSHFGVDESVAHGTVVLAVRVAPDVAAVIFADDVGADRVIACRWQ